MSSASDLLDPVVRTTTLDNGLPVTTVALPHLHTAACALFVRAGVRFESLDDNGLSHFTEHMLFRGTERYPTSLALSTAVERLGSTMDAQTGHDHTSFHLSVVPELLVPAIDLLGELVVRPRLLDVGLERERILEELNEDHDEHGAEINAGDIARGLLLEGHPLGQRIIGPKTNVERFTTDDVRRHLRTLYGARNAVLCVAGPVDHDAVVTAAARGFGELPAGARADGPTAPPPPPPAGPRLRYAPDGGSQTSLALSFFAVGETDPSYAALVSLLRVLDDGMSTRLHHVLSDQRGLAYSIHAWIASLVDVSLLEVGGATANGKVPTLLRDLLDLLAGLRRGEVTTEELAKARVRHRHDLLSSVDDAAAMVGWFGGAALYYPPARLSQRLAEMERIGVDDVVQIADVVLRPERLAVAAVGALPRTSLDELRRVVGDWR